MEWTSDVNYLYMISFISIYYVLQLCKLFEGKELMGLNVDIAISASTQKQYN